MRQRAFPRIRADAVSDPERGALPCEEVMRTATIFHHRRGLSGRRERGPQDSSDSGELVAGLVIALATIAFFLFAYFAFVRS
jgi:hypothetical protein